MVLTCRLPPREDGTRVVAVRSVSFPDAPQVPGSMLGMLAATGWVIRVGTNSRIGTISGAEGFELDKDTCRVTYCVAVNLEGIPQAVVNVAAKQIPLVAARLRLYLTGK